MKKRLAILLLVALFVGTELQAQNAAKPELRTWKDSSGQFNIEAVFVRVSGDQVVLQGADKKELSVPLAKLSGADRQYVQNIGSLVNIIGMKLKLIPAGEFQMGPAETAQYLDKDERLAEQTSAAHLVKITMPFYLGIYEVTQQQYEKVMGIRPWQGKASVKEGADYPAVYVWHDDALEFCRRLSKLEGVEYRLPTEAEWEYACRAGTTTAYSFGDDGGPWPEKTPPTVSKKVKSRHDKSKLGRYAWYVQNTSAIGEPYAHRVGKKLANPWGLYDMYGNVREWCQDWYGPYGSEKVVSDPMGPAQQVEFHHRVLRGGSWQSLPERYSDSSSKGGTGREARSNVRSFPKSEVSALIGFRAVRTFNVSPDAVKPELRSWKDLTGEFSIEAIFVRINGDQVVLQGADKKEISLRLAKLSETDREYVQKRLTPSESKEQKAITVLLKLNPLADITRDKYEHIVSLTLNSSKVTDAVLEHLKGLVNLERLELSSPEISDVGLEYLKGLTKLKSLSLSGTKITGAGLVHLQSLENLSFLHLKNTKLTGPGLRYLLNSSITDLTFLDCAELGDSSVEHIANLKSLKSLSLYETSVTRDGLKKLLSSASFTVDWSPRPNPIDLAFHSFNNWNSKPVFIDSNRGDVVQEFREAIMFSRTQDLAVHSADDRNKAVKPTALNIMFSFSDVRSEVSSGVLSNRVKEIKQQYLNTSLGTEGTVRFMNSVIEKFGALGSKVTRTKGNDGSNHLKWSYPKWNRVVTLDIHAKQATSVELAIIRVP